MNAEQALSMLNGTHLGGQSVRLSWGRSPSNKQGQSDQPQWNGGGGGYGNYPYGQGGYEAYQYPQPAQDPSMYYGGYPAGYGNYQQPGAYPQGGGYQAGGYQQQQQQYCIVLCYRSVLRLVNLDWVVNATLGEMTKF
ncbi:hypothetical protein ACFE04_006091 [Oxalis oulophora]